MSISVDKENKNIKKGVDVSISVDSVDTQEIKVSCFYCQKELKENDLGEIESYKCCNDCLNSFNQALAPQIKSSEVLE